MSVIHINQNVADSKRWDLAPDRRGWRQLLRIHPAAELFPLLPDDELRVLGEDIKKQGLLTPIALWVPVDCHPADEDFASLYLLDGRNRLDACEAVGIEVIDATTGQLKAGSFDVVYYLAPGHPDADLWPVVDPYEFVISVNIHRRHLTTGQKKELITKLLHERPERSDRQTAELAKVHHTAVSTIRTSLEATGEISQLTHNVGKDGKSRQRRKPIKILLDGAKNKGVTLDEYIQTITNLGEETPRSAEPHRFFTRNPAADPNITAAVELKTPLPASPKSRSLALVTPPVNGVPPTQNPVPTKAQKREEAIAAIVDHLHHDPTMFLSDLAVIMANDQARLARLSIFNRRSALTKIAHSLGLRITDDAWKGE